MHWISYVGIVCCWVGIVLAWRRGAYLAYYEGDTKSLKVRVLIGCGLGNLLFLVLGVVLAEGRPANASADTLSSAREELKAARVRMEEVDKVLAEGQVVLEAAKAKITEDMKKEAVPAGKSRLCYVAPADFEASEYDLIQIFIRHLDEKKIEKSIEQRGADRVTVRPGLDAAYVKTWLPVFEKVGVRAWVEE